MDIQGLAKYACCPEVFFPLRVGVLEQGIQDRAPCACCATVFFFLSFFVLLFVCLFVCFVLLTAHKIPAAQKKRRI